VGYVSTADEAQQFDPDLAAVFAESDDPALTSAEVAEALGMSQQGASARLTSAAAHGVVERKTVGARAVVWWIEGYCFNSA